MNPNQLQQGDVLLKRIDKLPKGAKALKKTGDVILANGDVTGHAHRIAAQPGVSLHQLDDVLFLKTEVAVELTHEEHKTFTIDPGVWQIGQVREFDYLTQMERTVID